MGVEKLREEYKELAEYTRPDMTANGFKLSRMQQNRSSDVKCQDQSRMILDISSYPETYIHANYVSTAQMEKRFICTQGPLEDTVSDFWAMLLQEGTTTIIMLCNTVEMGKDKCAQYWPEKEGETVTCERTTIVVTCIKVSFLPEEPSVRKTTLLVTWNWGEREITHFQWMDWPVGGLPPTSSTILQLLPYARLSHFPVVIHCSDGIGRKGVVVATEILAQGLTKRGGGMKELLKTLRNQRAYSIQNDLQYLFVHRMMLFHILEKNKNKLGSILKQGDYQDKYDKFVADYEAIMGGHGTEV